MHERKRHLPLMVRANFKNEFNLQNPTTICYNVSVEAFSNWLFNLTILFLQFLYFFESSFSEFTLDKFLSSPIDKGPTITDSSSEGGIVKPLHYTTDAFWIGTFEILQ